MLQKRWEIYEMEFSCTTVLKYITTLAFFFVLIFFKIESIELYDQFLINNTEYTPLEHFWGGSFDFGGEPDRINFYNPFEYRVEKIHKGLTRAIQKLGGDIVNLISSGPTAVEPTAVETPVEPEDETPPNRKVQALAMTWIISIIVLLKVFR